MRGSDNRVPLLTAILMAFLLAAIPATVQAQALGSTTSFDAATCINNQRNAYSNWAQGQATAKTNVFNNATNPSMKLVYCWDQVKAIFNTIGTLTAGDSLFGSAIWQLVQAAISSFLNQICQAVVGAITSAINMLKNLLCIPLPHFNLSAGFSLGSFGGGTCNGISLLSLGNATGTRPPLPSGYSPLWNYAPPSSR